MSEILTFPPSPPRPGPKPRKTHRVQMDEMTLGLVADWRAGRAAYLAAWAKHDKESLCWTKDIDDEIDHSGLRQMEQAEWHLSRCKPYTVCAARELLDCVIDILLAQEKDPEGPMATGPVFDIVKNIHKALQETDCDTRLATWCDEMKQSDLAAELREAKAAAGKPDCDAPETDDVEA